MACREIAVVPWRGVLGMQISKMRLSICNPNLFFVNTTFVCKSSTESFDYFCEVELWLSSKNLGRWVRFGLLTIMAKINKICS